MILVAAATEKELGAFFGRKINALSSSAVFRGREILCLSTGVGVINAAAELGAFLQQNPVSGVINVGIAGSYRPESLPLGALAVARREIWPELGVSRNAGFPKERLDFPLAELKGSNVFETLELEPEIGAESMGLSLPRDWPREIFLTVSGVSGTSTLAESLREKYSAGMENMEGFALGLVTAKFGVSFLEIRSVSNTAGSRQKMDWDFPAAFRALKEAGQRLLG